MHARWLHIVFTCVLAPGHNPRPSYRRGLTRAAVDEARRLVAAGQGDTMLSVEDANQGKLRTVRMKSAVLLSYFDPDGLGHMPGTIALLKPGVPLLYVVGTGDPLYPQGEHFAYDKAPPDPLNRYAVVQADHFGTPDAAVPVVRDWIAAVLAGR